MKPIKNSLKLDKKVILTVLVFLFAIIIFLLKGQLLYSISGLFSQKASQSILSLVVNDRSAIKKAIVDSKLSPSRSKYILEYSTEIQTIVNLLTEKLNGEISDEEKVFCYYFLTLKTQSFEHFINLFNMIRKPVSQENLNHLHARRFFPKLTIEIYKKDIYEYFEVDSADLIDLTEDSLRQLIKATNNKQSNGIKYLEDF